MGWDLLMAPAVESHSRLLEGGIPRFLVRAEARG